MTLSAILEGTSVARGAAGRMSRRLTVPFEVGGAVQHLELVAAAAGTADVTAYDFTDHTARYGRAPVPSYVLRTLRDLDRDVRVTVRVADPALPGGTGEVSVTLAAGTLTGESVPVLLPAGATESARLRRIVVTRRSGTDFVTVVGAVAGDWAISALLGNTARLLWVLGAERDLLRREIARTAAQWQLETAQGVSLDLIGDSVAVPRFPPLPYSVDDDTVALYHLDDAPGAPLGAEDATGLFPGRTPHHGTPSAGAEMAARGRYGAGVAFSGAGAVSVASNAAFNVPATASMTAECFVRPEAVSTEGRLLGRRGAAGAGWLVELGEFGRGLPRTLRATVSDGTREVVLHSSRTLPSDRFTHVALVLERSEASVSLWVDGVRADIQSAAQLGGLTVAQPLVIGPGAGSTLRATVDEVRISAVARQSFAPAIGEDDDHYRRRLRIFQRWCLPTPDVLTGVLNDAVGTIGGVAEPLVVDDADSPAVRGQRVVRVVPAQLVAGESMDAAGRRGVASEEELYGDADDRDIDPVLLLRHDASDVDYGPAASGDPHLMQPPLARMVDRLRGHVAAETAGRLRIVSAWTPEAPDARAAGRGVVLRHSAIASPRLAALAHRAGFLLVRTLPGSDGVYASCAPGRPIALAEQAAATPDTDVTVAVGSAVTLTCAPLPPASADIRWSVTRGGVRLTASSPPGTVTVDGLTPGEAIVTVDVLYGEFSATVSVAVRVLPVTLPAGSSIARDGTLGAPVDVAGPPAAAFDLAFLTSFTHPQVTLATPDAGRMQPGTADRLRDLLDGLTGTLTLTSGFVAAPVGAPTLAGQGRALTMRHSTLAVGRLAALAHAAGFSWVGVQGADVRVLQRAEDLVVVTGPSLVEEGEEVTLDVRPDPATVSALTRLHWSSGSLGPTSGRVELTSPAPLTVVVTGRQAGRVWVQAALRDAGAVGPYAMRVRLRGSVPAGATITRDQYDLIMNVVHALHPLGVEVLTRDIRTAVVELAGQSSLDPDYTYPKFRMHRSTARRRIDQPRKDLEDG